MWLVRVCRAVVALLAPLFGLQLSLGPGLYHLFLLLAEPQGLSGLNHRAYGQVELDRFKRHITYTIKEESEIGSFVGDLRIDSDIEQAVLTIGDSDGDGDGDGDSVGVGIGNRTLCFELYDDSTGGLFRLEFTSGQLFVARRIDREAICPGQAADQPELGHFSRLPDPVDQGNGNGNGNGEADGDSDVRRGGRDSVTAVCQLELTVFIAPSFWINVVVTVQDINDHEPRFPPTPASPSPSPSPSPSASALPSTGGRPDGVSSSVYTVRISEAVEPGYQVPLVGAIDEDIGANGIQTYRLHGDELTRDGMFELHFEPPYSLNLVVLGRLDTETTANYSGHLVACDAGLPVAKCGRQALLVLVTDVNDNKPVFAQPGYLVTVEESVAVGEVIARVSAVDADSGAFGQLTYHLGRTAEPGVTQHFAVRLDTGEVVVKAALNARRLPKASLPIVARDAGPIPLLGQTVLRVEVRDVNDHRPWIQVRPILPLTTGETTPLASTLASASASSSVAGRVTMSIVENRPAGSGVGLVISGDEDVGRNSEVTCRLTTGQRVFRLEHSNEAKGRQIYTLVTATRLDREAAPANGLLGVGIRCTDRGLPTPLATEEAFEVALLDEDEFAPQFEAGLGEPVTVRVEENLPAGSPVVRLTASDADATARLVYSLSTEAQAFFSVDPATGQVVTRLRLDREAQPDIDFMLLASDAVGPMATATATAKSTATARVRVRVLVTDVNDNAPRLSGRRVFRVIENQPGYSEPVGQLTGVDPDAGLNGTFEFRLVEVLAANRLRLPEAEKIFSLAAKTGRLFVQSALDREQQAVYHLLVRIQDLGRPTARNTTEEVRIEVADENDNPPVWQTPRAFGLYVDYTPTSPSPSPSPLTTQARRLLNAALRWAGSDQVELYEYGLVNLSRPVLPGHSIVTLAASDPDAPENANLTFDLIAVQPLRTPTTTPTPTPTATATATVTAMTMTMSVVTRGRRLTGRDDVNSLFSLNRLTGDLQTGSGSLAQGLFEVRLRVSDNGQPTLTTDARLFVHTAGPSLGLYALLGHKGVSVASHAAGDGDGDGYGYGYGSPTAALLTDTSPLSFPLVVGLVGVTCLVSVCLLIAIGLARHRATTSATTAAATTTTTASTATATSCLAPVSSVDVDVGAVDVKRRLPLVEHDRSYSDAAGLLPPAYPPGLDPTAHLCQVPTSPNHATSTPNRHLLIAPPYLRSDDDRCLGYAMATRLFAPGSGSCRLDAWRSRADEPSLASLEANHHQTGLLDLSLGLPGMETDSILTHHMSAEYASLFKSPGSFFSDRGHVKSTDNSPALHSLR